MPPLSFLGCALQASDLKPSIHQVENKQLQVGDFGDRPCISNNGTARYTSDGQ